MAAPTSNITWGNTVTGSKSTRKGKIGIYTGITETSTQYKVTVQVWFWSMYSIDDSNNTYTYNGTAIGSIDINHTVATGDGWSTSNQTKLGESTYTYDKGTSTSTKTYTAKFTGIDSVGSSNVMSASRSITVPALASYTVTYNANGGTGAPSQQTKWYGKNLTLSTTKPTRSGYSFLGWATSSTATSANGSYDPGDTYSGNANLTLYAVWKANGYTVTYNANGGTGAPSSQNKTYGVTLTLSSTKPTRTNYTFIGWGTSANATTASYQPGGSYTANAAITLYAIWQLAYKNPVIYNLTASRCDSEGHAVDDGTNCLISFKWETERTVTSIVVSWQSAESNGSSKTLNASGTAGTVSEIIGPDIFDIEHTYAITVVVSDSGGSSPTALITLPGAVFPIDVLSEGKGISFGKPAELPGVADFGWEGKFNKPVYGKALGMDKVPNILSGSDLNTYIEPGCYAIYKNADAATITCGGVTLGSNDTIPPAVAGRLEVWSVTGEGIRSDYWGYIRQRFIPYNSTNPVWERDVTKNSDNVWTYYDWWRSTLTPNISNSIYHKQKVLASPSGWYMTSSQSFTLSEPISKQMNGIVIVFSAYIDGTPQNYDFISYYVPKELIAQLPSKGHSFPLMRIDCADVGVKYLLIDDTRIWGDDRNQGTGTANNISYKNNRFVLRYVFGV